MCKARHILTLRDKLGASDRDVAITSQPGYPTESLGSSSTSEGTEDKETSKTSDDKTDAIHDILDKVKSKDIILYNAILPYLKETSMYLKTANVSYVHL